MNVNVEISIDPFKQKNDFYFQWDYIFWWQMRFNTRYALIIANEKVKEHIIKI